MAQARRPRRRWSVRARGESRRNYNPNVPRNLRTNGRCRLYIYLLYTRAFIFYTRFTRHEHIARAPAAATIIRNALPHEMAAAAAASRRCSRFKCRSRKPVVDRPSAAASRAIIARKRHVSSIITALPLLLRYIYIYVEFIPPFYRIKNAGLRRHNIIYIYIFLCNVYVTFSVMIT